MKYFKIQKYIIKIKILKSVIQIIIKYFTKKPLKNKQKQKQKKNRPKEQKDSWFQSEATEQQPIRLFLLHLLHRSAQKQFKPHFNITK